jgi:hypothetical protein
MRIAVSALILFFSVIASAQNAPQYASDLVKGPGFTISLPPGVVVNLAPTDETAHGFGLDLLRSGQQHDWDRQPLRYIAFNTRWDAGDLPSLAAVVSSMTQDLSTLVPQELHGAGTIRLVSTFPAKLGDLPAKRLIVEFTNAEKKPSIRQIVVAYRVRPDASGMVYVASLTTTRVSFEQDVEIFAKMLAGFKLTAVE